MPNVLFFSALANETSRLLTQHVFGREHFPVFRVGQPQAFGATHDKHALKLSSPRRIQDFTVPSG